MKSLFSGDSTDAAAGLLPFSVAGAAVDLLTGKIPPPFSRIFFGSVTLETRAGLENSATS